MEHLAARRGERWAWVLLLAAAPFLLFPTVWLSPVLLVVPLSLWLLRRASPLRTALDLPVLLMATMLLVSLYATYSVAVSLPKIAGVMLGVAAYYTYARLAMKTEHWWWGLAGFFGVGLGVSVVGLLATRWAQKFVALQPFMAGLPTEGIINPNEVAGALLWVIPPLLMTGVFWLRTAKTLRNHLGEGSWLLLGVIVVSANLLVLITFILTQSRSAYTGLALALPVLGAFALPAKPRQIASFAAVSLFVIGAGSVWALGPETVVQRIGLRHELQGRGEIWERGLWALQDFSITGMGMNTFRHIVPVMYPFLDTDPGRDIGHAHNEFLQAGLDLGLPGMVALAALYVGSFWTLLRIDRMRSTELNRFRNGVFDPAYFTLGFGGGLLAHMFYGLTDAVALGAKPGLLFWMLLGLIAGLERLCRSESSGNQSNLSTQTVNT
jgi:O-antigen ligase